MRDTAIYIYIQYGSSIAHLPNFADNLAQTMVFHVYATMEFLFKHLPNKKVNSFMGRQFHHFSAAASYPVPRCRHTSGRSFSRPYGNVGYVFVRTGNILGCRVCLLILVCSYLGLRWLLEQPSGSCFYVMPRFQLILELLDVPWQNQKNSNNEMCFDFSRSLQLWKHETPTMLTEKCCRGSGWIRGMFHAAIRKLRCGLEDFGWAASRV